MKAVPGRVIGRSGLVLATVALCVGMVACGGSRGQAGTADGTQTADGAESEGATMQHSYGDDPNQFGELTVPHRPGGSDGADGADGDPVPVVVLIHGGFWRTGFGADLMEPLVPSLTDAGYAVWNVEYRRVGTGPEGGGGFPATFDDLAAAIDLLAALPEPTRSLLDLDRVATVGHSAGGHLAVWLASRTSIDGGPAPWAAPAVTPVLAVSQAGVLDLEQCIAEGIGGTACSDLLLGPGDSTDELPSRIGQASPAALLPIQARVVAVHGTLDRIVPLSQSTQYAAEARDVGIDVAVSEIDGADHFDVIDPGHLAWQAVLDALADQFGSV